MALACHLVSARGASLRAGFCDPPPTPDEATAAVVGAGNPGVVGDDNETAPYARPRTATAPTTGSEQVLPVHRSSVLMTGPASALPASGTGLQCRPRAARARSRRPWKRERPQGRHRRQRADDVRARGQGVRVPDPRASPSSDVYSDGRSGRHESPQPVSRDGQWPTATEPGLVAVQSP